MDHVINSMRQWLTVFEDRKPDDIDEKAIKCINNAIRELNKYYNYESNQKRGIDEE